MQNHTRNGQFSPVSRTMSGRSTDVAAMSKVLANSTAQGAPTVTAIYCAPHQARSSFPFALVLGPFQ